MSGEEASHRIGIQHAGAGIHRLKIRVARSHRATPVWVRTETVFPSAEKFGKLSRSNFVFSKIGLVQPSNQIGGLLVSSKSVGRLTVAVIGTFAAVAGLFVLMLYARKISDNLGHVAAFGGGLVLARVVYKLAQWVRSAG
jgi:hypothetical protein